MHVDDGFIMNGRSEQILKVESHQASEQDSLSKSSLRRE